MESTGKHHITTEAAPDLGSILNDIASLKRDFAALAHHLKDGTLPTRGQCSIKAISRQVEEQPVLSMLIAFAAGFIGSQLLSRSREMRSA
jgi:hypothetical protein